MRPGASWALFGVLAAGGTLLAGPAGGLAAGASTAPECAADSYRQLDFWLGDWDVYDLGGTTPVARAHITRILEGCVVHERYESQHTLGESFSILTARAASGTRRG